VSIEDYPALQAVREYFANGGKYLYLTYQPSEEVVQSLKRDDCMHSGSGRKVTVKDIGDGRFLASTYCLNCGTFLEEREGSMEVC